MTVSIRKRMARLVTLYDDILVDSLTCDGRQSVRILGNVDVLRKGRKVGMRVARLDHK